MTAHSLTNAVSENQISASHNPIMPENEDPEQPQQQNPPCPTTLTLETERPQNSDPPHQRMELDPNQDDVEMITPIPDNVIVTPSVPARRGGGVGKRKKQAQLKRRAAFEKKSLSKLLVLKETLKPIPFTPVINKTQDFNRHESLLKRVGLWDFVHMEFDPYVRADLVAQLIANYNHRSRGSHVNGVRIGVNRADLARALRIPVRKDKGIGVNAAGVSDGSVEVRVEKESEESIKIVDEIVSNWMFLHGDTWCLPEDVVNMTRPIKEGNLEKMDWAGLIWYMMEKELSASELENCYYATYMQCLIKSQKEELLREEVKVDSEDDCDGDVSMSDRVDDVKVIESEENSVELSLGQENVVDLKEVVENESVEKEGMETVENEEKVGDEQVENEEKVGDEKVVKEGREDVEKDEEEIVGKDEEDIVGKDEEEVVEKDEKEIVEKDENEILETEEVGDLGKEETENVGKEEMENVAKEGKEDVGNEGNEIVEEGEEEDVEKEQQEVSVAEEVIKFEDTENDEDNGQLFLDGSNLGGKEPFLRRCDPGEVESMDFEEQKQIQEMEGEEEGRQGEEDDDDDEEEEEEEEEDEPEQEQEGPFLLSMGGETLEGVNSANLIQGMEAVSQVPFSSGVRICDDDITADFLGSRVDNNAIPGSSSHFGQNNKREMDHDNEVPHHSLNGSSKRMRTGGAWENKSPLEFDMCLDQVQHWMGKARIMYMEKEQACNELSMNQQLLLNELHKQEATIQHLHKVKFEEQQKRQREIYRLERELFIMTDLLDGYRKALKETRNAFADYRARFPQFDVPLYRDVPGGGGLMLTAMELEKQRLKQEEEERMNRLLIENRIKDFEAEYMAKFEAHRYVVESLNGRLLNIENQIEPLRELLAKRKVSDSSECAAPNE